MAFTLENVQALERAIAEGAKSVMFQDRDGGIKRVQYDSLDDMLRRLTIMKKELGLIAHGPNRRVAAHSKGL